MSQKQLYKFQEEGVRFAVQKRKVLLADEMGLGKSVQAIRAIQQLGAFPCIVIAPKAVVSNWKNEIEKWGGTAQIITSKFKFNNPSLFESDQPEFYIINYDIIIKQLDELLTIPYKALIIDEIHYAKNYKAKRTKGVERLIQEKYDKAKRENPLIIIGLSGTPILNHGTEIHQIAKLINPYCLGFSFFTFADRYCTPAPFGGYELNHSALPELNERLKEIMLRRKKAEVLTELPDKTRIDVELCIDEREYLNQIRAQVQILKEQFKDDSQILLGLMSRERRITGTLKAEKVVEFMLDRLEETNEKIVVFAHHKDVIQTISSRLKEEGYDNSVYVGEMSDEQRQKALDDFQTKHRVIIISMHAGGTGINLQFANYVVFAELDWSPSQLQQAEDRCHRIGQKNNVTVYYLFAKNTIDEDITNSVVRKMQVINAIVDNIELEAKNNKENAYHALLRSL
jgi:SWI/SNF-related matrix-associated actin-dependent regulator 1 of chromatin subfamily A